MRRSYISLAIGIVLAVAAVVLLNFYVRSLRGTPTVALTQVVVTTKDLPFGTPLNSAYLNVVPWPAASVPAGAFTSVAEIFKDADKPADRVAITLIAQGEPILKSKISGFGTRPIMSAQVKDGMRAISIHIDDVSGVAGFILPGDHVDIVLTRGAGADLVNDLFMQDVEVLGIDQLSDQKSDKPTVGRTATVEVTPEQAQKLILAQQAGTLSLSLRAMAASDNLPAAHLAADELVAPARPKSAAPPKPVVRVRYGDGSVVATPVN